jgi:hypothetical protein
MQYYQFPAATVPKCSGILIITTAQAAKTTTIITQYCGIKRYKETEVLVNMPNIIIKNKKDDKDDICLLTDVAIPSDRNVVQNDIESKLKYKTRTIEVC